MYGDSGTVESERDWLRSTLQAIAALGLAGIWALAGMAVLGPHKLPGRIPVHFNALGQIDAWGSPAMLWFLPGVATGIYLLMTLVARHPGAFNYPVRVTPLNRPRLEAISLNLIAWLQAELLWLFLFIEYASIRSVRLGRSALSPWMVPICIAVIFLTVGWHIAAMVRAGRPKPR